MPDTGTTFRPGANRAASAAPVRHHAGRRDDQERRGRRVTLPGVADQGEGLQRLTEPHVVGEDSAQPVLPEERQPAEPVLLVRAQPGLQPGRGLGAADSAGRQQALDLLPPRRRLMSDHSQRGQLIPEPGLIPADPQRAARRILQRAGLLDQPGERTQLRLVEGEVGAVGQQQVRLAPAEGQEHLEERHRASFHGDRHAEIEPVGVAGHLVGGHRDPQ